MDFTLEDLFRRARWVFRNITIDALIKLIEPIRYSWFEVYDQYSNNMLNTTKEDWPLLYALIFGCDDHAKILVEYGHPVDLVTQKYTYSVKNFRPTHFIRFCSNFNLYRLMIEHGAPCRLRLRYLYLGTHLTREWIEYVFMHADMPIQAKYPYRLIVKGSTNIVQGAPVMDFFDLQQIIRSPFIEILSCVVRNLGLQSFYDEIGRREMHTLLFNALSPKELEVYPNHYLILFDCLAKVGLIQLSYISYETSKLCAFLALKNQSFVQALFEQEDLF
jgi:hypothetical protein